MNRRLFPFAILLIAACVTGDGWVASAAEQLELRSPDGTVAVEFRLNEGTPLWSVTWDGKTILGPSRLGLTMKDGSLFSADLILVSSSRASQDSTWKPVYGERNSIRDNYNALTVVVAQAESPSRLIHVTFRAYDEGVAFCYTIPAQEGLNDFVIEKELSEFCFADDHICYPVYSAQGVYERVPLSRVKPGCERPLTIIVDPDTCVAVAEARLVDYARMRLRPVKTSPYALEAVLAGQVRASAPYRTPWRVLILGHTPGNLLDRNYLILNLNDPCAIPDTSWIKPGKVIREVTLTTKGGKACVDFAVAHNLQYIEFDAGWYGPENDDSADARTVTLDPKRSKGPLDLPEVIRYAADRGIGVWLYVNRRHLERQLDEILPLYKSWGIKGVKYGFVQVGNQHWTQWLHEAIRKAAEYGLMVDVHDEYRPTGYSRTYPNFLTQEGISGNETMPTPEQNLTLPFTRYLCGAGDATICWYTDRIKTSRAHQLAASVVFYSPLQFVFWYDRPEQYEGEPGVEFFDHLPTVWDKSRVLQGEIGRYISVARRNGEEWYVATMNAGERRVLSIVLDFLDDGRLYQALSCGDDDPTGAHPTAVKCTTQFVKTGDTVAVDCAANGGHAMRLSPVKSRK